MKPSPPEKQKKRLSLKERLKHAPLAVKIVLALLVIYVISLFFREQELPRFAVKMISSRLSNKAVEVKLSGARFGFAHGFTITGIKIYDLTRLQKDEAIATASSVSIDPIRHKIHIVNLSYPRLPDSYYASGYVERNEPLIISLPDLHDFRLILDSPDILGIAPTRATAQVLVRRNMILLDEIHVDWPDADARLGVDGYFRIDLNEQRAHGVARGLATQEHIRPLMVALDIPSALPYFDAFTEVPASVNAAGDFDVDLVNNDFKMKLELRPELGKYNGVEMARAEGNLNLDVSTRGTNCNIRFEVDLPMAVDKKGRQMFGSIAVNITNEFIRLDYDATSRLLFPDIVHIADFIDYETLASVVDCETAPDISVKGHTGTCAEDADWNDLKGTIKLARGAVLGMKLNNIYSDFSFKGEELSFFNAHATGKNGGVLQGEAKISFPGFDENAITFEAKIDHQNGTLEEIAEVLDIELDGRDGKLDARVELSGPVSTNMLSKLNGFGSMNITDGHLLQMRLFAGLTEQLAAWVPGVGYLVNQSEASYDFKIVDGIVSTDNLIIEGGLVSIKGWGTYDIEKDMLDFNVRVEFFKDRSFAGKILHPVTWPFTKLLLEFHASGSADAPKWDYVSMIDRIF